MTITALLRRSLLFSTAKSFQRIPISHIRYISNTQAASTTPVEPPTPGSNNYLDTLNNSELFGYGVIGLATLNKPILDLVIKLFPYTPLWLIKSLIYQNYCGGDNFQQLLKTGERLAERGIKNMMISYTVEACDGKEMSISIPEIIKGTSDSIPQMLVPHTVKMIEETENINDIPPGYVALKPTGLIENAAQVLLNYKNPAFSKQYNELLNNCIEICRTIKTENEKLHIKYPERIAPFVVAVIDAERNDLQQGVYKLQRDLFEVFNKKEVCVVGTVQMYLKESTPLLLEENELAKVGKYKLGWKLVRGAYLHTEPDRNVIHNTKSDTDKNYDTGIEMTLKNMASENPTVGHLVVASHNYETQKKATQSLQSVNNKNVTSNVVLGQLLGMADNITYDLINKYNVKNIIKYVPWGPPLETKEYLLRRLEENGDAVRADSGWPLLKGIVKTFFKRIF